MKQQYVSASQALCQPLEYDRRVGIDRVESAPGPTCKPQSQACQHGLQKRAAKPGRRPKESGPLTRNGFNCVLGAGDFSRDTCRPQHREPVKVMLTVVLNRVTAPDDFPRQVGMLLDQLANAEESRLG